MLSRYSKINKYGGHTWHIEMEDLYHIFIHETETSSFIIECKEWKWLGYKTHFSFVSGKDLKETIIEAFSRVYDFVVKKNTAWSYQSQVLQLTKTLDLLSQYNTNINTSKKNSIRENGSYIAHLSGRNPDTRRPYEMSIILTFKGNQCALVEQEGLTNPADISKDTFLKFEEDGLSISMPYETHGDKFQMRLYKSADKEQWDEWIGRIVDNGLILSMNSHFFHFFQMKVVDNSLYEDAHFKFFAIKD